MALNRRAFYNNDNMMNSPKALDLESREDAMNELLSRGVDEVIDRAHLERRLREGKPLRVKFGTDPTSPNLHLGRSIPLLKLRDFQKLGHKIVLIIGDFTGTIGDTSDKESERPMLSEKEVAANMKTYITQAGKILDVKKTEVVYNSKWLGKLGYGEIGHQADVFSLSDFIARENIKKRLDAGRRVSLRELLYPLMQGYDSVQVKADVEIGGTDQRFNLLAGRDLQKQYGQEPQDILMGPIIEGLDGRKMSSSYGNTVNLLDAPNDMFGKIMSLHDEFIVKYFTLLTRVPMDEIGKYEVNLKGGANPRDIKIKLAKEIVRMYHGEKEAQAAEAYFIHTFTTKEIPDEMPEYKIAVQDAVEVRDVISVLVNAKMVASKSEARRAIEQGGVKINGEVVKDAHTEVPRDAVLQKGKVHFVRVR